ncbi:2Fe-2S iron-sulfur cluster-binding protein [Streptomyces sp. NPDC050636]|uniref:2Fe-2S iron-sulfur cluster-binding protein n=1 Tax=Streptomyces sp. NPDC050636 TaxID=3154510 RepID=UPI003435BAB1
MSTPEFCAHIARASGLTAWWLVSAAVLWGLLHSTRVIGRAPGAARRIQAHRQLAAASLVFTAIHLASLAVDPRLLFGWAEFLAPLPTRHRPLAGAWGVAAVYLLVAIQITSLLRSRLPQRLWRHVHRSSFAVFVLVTLHALTAGKATGDPLTRWTATVTGAAFGLLVAHRLHAGRRIARTLSRLRPSRHPRPAAPPTVPGFHRLHITDIRQETPDTVSLAFDIPAELTAAFRFRPGQHLTLRAVLDGNEALRPYSISSGIADGELRIAVKQHSGGKVSTWINTRLRTGDQVDIAPPRGRFTTDLHPLQKRHLLAIAAGSGITPVISIVKSVLAVESHSRCTLVYGSRDSQSTIFRGQLALLSCTYGDRLRVIHVHSRGHCPDPLLRGRLTGAKIRELADVLALTHDLGEAFLSGPEGLIADIRAALTELGLAPQHIHTERFSGHRQDTPAPSGRQRPYDEAGARTARVHVIDRGVHTTVTVPAPHTVLDAGLHAGLDLPHSCREGVCGTCRAKVTSGQVRLLAPCALQPADIDAGYVLACRTLPVADKVTIDFDQG